jgi:hypothetical protein
VTFAVGGGVKDPRRARALGVVQLGKDGKTFGNSAKLLEATTVYAVVTVTRDHGNHDRRVESVKVGKVGDLEKPMSLSGEKGARRIRRCAPRIRLFTPCPRTGIIAKGPRSGW